MKPLSIFYAAVFLVSTAHADEAVNDPAEFSRFNAPQAINDGYQIKLERPPADAEGNYRLILTHPDGKEDVIWSPPNRQPDNRGRAFEGVSILVRFSEPFKAHIFRGQLGVIILKDDNWWWIRWDMHAKKRLPLIEFYKQPSMMKLHLVDVDTVELLLGRWGKKFTLKADSEGMLFKDGEPWLQGFSYSAYGENWIVTYGGSELNGKVTRNNSPKAWPFITKQAIQPTSANAQEPPRDSPPPLPVPAPAPNTTHAASQPPVMPVTQAPTVTAESSAPMWPWAVGITALVAIAWLFLKRRA